MEERCFRDGRVRSKQQGFFRSWRLGLFLILLAFLASCSPKTVPVKKPETPPVVVTPPPVKEEVVTKKHISSIALVLPFQLDKLNPKSIQQKDITRSAMALDFYQGFKMALDSLAEKGHNFKVEVLDNRDNVNRSYALTKVAGVQNSDIIIGPVFPDGIKVFSETSALRDKLEVSPLAAAMPAQFHNPKLVSMNNSIDQHAQKLADFLGKQYKAEQINMILLNPRKPDDEAFAAPLRKFLVAGRKFMFTEVSTIAAVESNLSASKVNVVIVGTDNPGIVLTSVGKLYLKRQSNKIEVYGHPNWGKLRNLEAEKLQALNTRITSSYFIDSKSPAVKSFNAAYKANYEIAPSEFAYKGFDTGYIFGSLLAKYGKDYAKHLDGFKYDGLHNDFRFGFDPGFGFTNKNLMMLRYSGFALMVEE
jgi:hypothetical protein